ncbi:MAG: helix-turn-helix domain-containing protein [Haloarculaceae archaeon]
MSQDPSDGRRRAIATLGDLGLSTYAARVLVALVVIEEGTAAEISEASEVPRARVYDAAEELRGRGLVVVAGSDPRQFEGVPPDTIEERLRREYERRIDDLAVALSAIDEDE